MSKTGRRDRERIERLDALYAQLPRIQCRGLCAEACGPIPLATSEAQRMQRAAHVAPRTTPASVCIHLKGGRCSVYAQRPLICRLWGVAENLSCMFGCEPDRWLSAAEVLDLIAAIEAIGGPILMTTSGGVVEYSGPNMRAMLGRVDPAALQDPETAKLLGEMTRTARALLGGYVVGVVPGGPGGFVRVDGQPEAEGTK